jgi:hypothetical protein
MFHSPQKKNTQDAPIDIFESTFVGFILKHTLMDKYQEKSNLNMILWFGLPHPKVVWTYTHSQPGKRKPAFLIIN